MFKLTQEFHIILWSQKGHKWEQLNRQHNPWTQHPPHSVPPNTTPSSWQVANIHLHHHQKNHFSAFFQNPSVPRKRVSQSQPLYWSQEQRRVAQSWSQYWKHLCPEKIKAPEEPPQWNNRNGYPSRNWWHELYQSAWRNVWVLRRTVAASAAVVVIGLVEVGFQKLGQLKCLFEAGLWEVFGLRWWERGGRCKVGDCAKWNRIGEQKGKGWCLGGGIGEMKRRNREAWEGEFGSDPWWRRDGRILGRGFFFVAERLCSSLLLPLFFTSQDFLIFFSHSLSRFSCLTTSLRNSFQAFTTIF